MSHIYSSFFPSQTQVLAREKQRERAAKIAEASSIFRDLNEFDKAILQTKAEDLVSKLKNGAEGYTCVRVMTAFVNAAVLAHERTNCITELMLNEAFTEARAKDSDREQGIECKGAFWGLPFSFKDTFNVRGVDTSVGCSKYCFDPITDVNDEGGLVKLVRMAGGIPFCKTNVPQTLLAFECANPIFGRTSHPETSSRTCGGSSGGEASLVALYGSAFGWGSDIGGSLRIPAHYSGIYAIKPVQGRLPIHGSFEPVPGFDAIKAMVGPMARSIDDLIFATKSMIDLVQIPTTHMPGESLLPIPWAEPEASQQLNIGYTYNSGAVKTSPACYRAVMEAADRLRSLGHKVELFFPPDPTEAVKIFAALTSADGYKALLKNIGPDPMEPSMRLVTLGSKLPRWLHRAACWVIKNILRDPVFADVFSVSRPKSVSEYWSWCKRRDDFSEKFTSLAWDQKKYDAVICPVQAVPALEHGATELLSPLACATIQFNVCDSTVGVMPVTRVHEKYDKCDEKWIRGSKGSWILEKRVYTAEKPAYDAKKMHGLPVGVQIVGPPHEEERILRIMQQLDRRTTWNELRESRQM